MVGSVVTAVVPSEGAECSDGAVVGSVVSAVVPSAGVEFSDGAVVDSVVSVDVPSDYVECSEGRKDSLGASVACLFRRQYKVRSFER